MSLYTDLLIIIPIIYNPFFFVVQEQSEPAAFIKIFDMIDPRSTDLKIKKRMKIHGRSLITIKIILKALYISSFTSFSSATTIVVFENCPLSFLI